MSQQIVSTNRGWMVTLAGASINVILGTLYAWSVMGKAIGGAWHWSQMQCAMPFAVSTAAFALTMIFAGRVQDKIGPKRVAMVGGLLLGTGMILSAFTQEPYIIMLTFGVLGGMGIGIGYAATTPAALKWFPPAKKGLISGIVVAGVGLAAVFMAPLTRYLLGSLNPNAKYPSPLVQYLPATSNIGNTFFVLGIGTILVIGLLAFLLQNPPAGYQPVSAVPAGKKPLPTGRDMDWREMLHTPQFYGLWLMYVLSAAPGLMIIANSVQILSASDKTVDFWFAPMVVAAFNTIGRIFGGFLSDRIGRRQTLILVFLLQAVNMGLLSFYATPNMLIVGLATTGLFYGSFFALMPAAAADFYGLKNMGVNYGMIFTGFGVAGVLGSLMGGKVMDVFGSYARAYYVFVGMLVVSAILAFFTRTPKIRAQAASPELAGTGA